MRTFARSTALAAATLGLSLLSVGAHAQTTITFNEAGGFAAGFNGQTNPFLLSTDGMFRVEAFWLNTSGHFHIINSGGNLLENNHNQAGGVGNLNNLQGVRITSTDNGLFTLQSMGLFGQAAIGNISNTSTGAGAYTLFNGSGTMTAPGLVNFGGTFSGVSSIVIADPFAAGGNGFNNGWDNIVLVRGGAVVPEPGSMAMMAAGLLPLGLALRRRIRK